MLTLNLLPQEKKERFEWERNRRLAVLSLVTVLSILLFFAGLLATSIWYMNIRLDPLTIAIEREAGQEETQRAQEIETFTKNAIAKIKNIRTLQLGSEGYADFIRFLATFPPQRVVLTSFSITEKTGEDGMKKIVRLTGHAETREEVILFEEILRKSNRIEDLFSPFTNKNKPRDIDFVFTFNLAR